MKTIFHIVIAGALTLLTQIGGLIWILNFGFYKWSKSNKSRWFRLCTFIGIYLLMTFLIIPVVVPLSGRVPLPVRKSGNLIPHNLITPILNRHYVNIELRSQLLDISNSMNDQNNKLKVSYLDANFPFIDGFPLLPHLSHDDGKKVDLTFYYTKSGKAGNLKPSTSGYGIYVDPFDSEFDQTSKCLSEGYWQYDYSKYFTLGSRRGLQFDAKNTENLIYQVARSPFTQKILIEPHLKSRMNLIYDKVRFQGCHSVRHDDHIHLQIK